MNTTEFLGWVLSSNYRTKVLMEIDLFVLPSEIVTKTSIRFSHVSRALSELESKSLITIENPNASKGRLYSLTPEGRKIKLMITSKDNFGN